MVLGKETPDPTTDPGNPDDTHTPDKEDMEIENNILFSVIIPSPSSHEDPSSAEGTAGPL